MLMVMNRKNLISSVLITCMLLIVLPVLAQNATEIVKKADEKWNGENPAIAR